MWQPVRKTSPEMRALEESTGALTPHLRTTSDRPQNNIHVSKCAQLLFKMRGHKILHFLDEVAPFIHNNYLIEELLLYLHCHESSCLIKNDK